MREPIGMILSLICAFVSGGLAVWLLAASIGKMPWKRAFWAVLAAISFMVLCFGFSCSIALALHASELMRVVLSLNLAIACAASAVCLLVVVVGKLHRGAALAVGTLPGGWALLAAILASSSMILFFGFSHSVAPTVHVSEATGMIQSLGLAIGFAISAVCVLVVAVRNLPGWWALLTGAGVILFMVLIFGVGYMAAPTIWVPSEGTPIRVFGICLYASVLSLSNMGFARIVPYTDLGFALSALEGLTGYVMLALFATLFFTNLKKNGDLGRTGSGCGSLSVVGDAGGKREMRLKEELVRHPPELRQEPARTCTWQSRLLQDYQCRHPAEPGRAYCILHERGQKDAEKFIMALLEQVGEEGPPQRNPRFDFSGYAFPSIFTANGSGPSASWRTVLPHVVPGDLRCPEATFNGGVDLSRIEVQGNAVFDGARFRAGASFKAARIGGALSLAHCEFKEDLHLEGVSVAGSLLMDFSHVQGTVFLQRATIHRNFRLRSVRCDADLWIDSLEVWRRSVLWDAAFAGILRAHKPPTFRLRSCFGFASAKGLDLGGRKPSILWWWLGKRAGVTIGDTASAASFWQFARACFERQGDKQRADAAYYFEREASWYRDVRISKAGRRSQLAKCSRLAREGHPMKGRLMSCTLRILHALAWVGDLIIWILDWAYREATGYGASLSRSSAVAIGILIVLVSLRCLATPLGLGLAVGLIASLLALVAGRTSMR